MTRATLKQVAAAAGVSYQTVSNVLNDSPLVRPETRERVLRAVRELDYQPNFAARSLRAAKSMTLTCAFHGHDPDVIADPYRNLVQAAVVYEADALGYGVLSSFLRPDRPATLEEFRRRHQQRRFDGAVIVGAHADSDVLDHLRTWKVPFVLYDGSGPVSGSSAVTARYASGMQQLVERLARQGRRDLTLVIPEDRPGTTAHERLTGFLEATKAHGVRGTVVPGDWSFESGERAFHALWRSARRPGAVLAGNDRMAAGCLAAARTLGVRVPDDVAITGFDDFEFGQYTSPTLTTVRVPYPEMARVAVRRLITEISTPGAPPAVEHLPVTLVARGSG